MGGHAAILTFEPHPARLFAPDRAPRALTTPEDKRALIERSGVDVLFVQKFDPEFARWTPREFAVRALHHSLRARRVVVGYDFAFGADRAGDAIVLQRLGEELGFEVTIVAPQTATNGHVASSTAIRRALTAGDTALANMLLERPYHVGGRVIEGDQRGSAIGFPTANIDVDNELLPADGVYAGWLSWGDGAQPAVANIGVKPTFGAHRRTVEAHVLGVAPEFDIYGRYCHLYFATRIREERRFGGVDALVAQIGRDRDAVPAALADHIAPDPLPLPGQ